MGPDRHLGFLRLRLGGEQLLKILVILGLRVGKLLRKVRGGQNPMLLRRGFSLIFRQGKIAVFLRQHNVSTVFRQGMLRNVLGRYRGFARMGKGPIVKGMIPRYRGNIRWVFLLEQVLGILRQGLSRENITF